MAKKRGHINYPKKRKSAPPKSIETRLKIGWSKTGSRHPSWRGNKVNYSTLHFWVRKWKGTPDTCEKCGRSGLKGKQVVWANIDHKYRRVLDDYIRLCSTCHGKYDKELGLRKHKSLRKHKK